MEWRLADAKNRFSELVNKALKEGPQRVRRHKDSVIVIAEQEYEGLIGRRPGLKEFLLQEGPLLDEVDLTRDTSPMRDLKL